MDVRLLPVNAFISMCTANDGWPAPLADANYRLEGLEIPVRENGTIVLDAVARRSNANAMLAAEAKSGANIDVDQARLLSTITAKSVVRAGSIKLEAGADPLLDRCYVALAKHEERVKIGFEKSGIDLPLVLVDLEEIRSVGRAFADDDVERAFSQPIRSYGPPPCYVPADVDSPDERFSELLRPQVIACMAQGETQVSVRLLAERAVRYLPLMGQTYRTRMLRKFEEAAQRLALEFDDFVELLASTTNAREPVFLIKQTPEQAQPRGRTQQYQALARKSHVTPTPHSRDAPGQMRLEDLLEEMREASDSDPADDQLSTLS